jgi:hypothetical protein
MRLPHGHCRWNSDRYALIIVTSDLHNKNPKPFKWTKSADQILASVKRFCHKNGDRTLSGASEFAGADPAATTADAIASLVTLLIINLISFVFTGVSECHRSEFGNPALYHSLARRAL